MISRRLDPNTKPEPSILHRIEQVHHGRRMPASTARRRVALLRQRSSDLAQTGPSVAQHSRHLGGTLAGIRPDRTAQEAAHRGCMPVLGPLWDVPFLRQSLGDLPKAESLRLKFPRPRRRDVAVAHLLSPWPHARRVAALSLKDDGNDATAPGLALLRPLSLLVESPRYLTKKVFTN